MHDRYDNSPDEEDSEGTIDLPARFDEHGNRKADDPLSEKINDLLSGKGLAGGLFRNLTGSLLNPDHDQDDNDGRTGRRRHRR